MAVKEEAVKLTFSSFNPILKYSFPRKDGDSVVPAAVAYDLPFELDLPSLKDSVRGRIETVFVFSNPKVPSIYEYISPYGNVPLSDEKLDEIFDQIQVIEERSEQLREQAEFFAKLWPWFQGNKTPSRSEWMKAENSYKTVLSVDGDLLNLELCFNEEGEVSDVLMSDPDRRKSKNCTFSIIFAMAYAFPELLKTWLDETSLTLPDLFERVRMQDFRYQ